MSYVERIGRNGKVTDRYYTPKRRRANQATPERYVVLQVSQEQLEEAVAGLQQLKPIIAQQVALGNQKMGSSKEQTETDVREVTAHFDTAITAMYMLLNNFYEGADHDRGREKNSGNT